MTWFEELTGCEEHSADQVRSELSIDGEYLVFPNGKRRPYGALETPRNSELRAAVESIPSGKSRLAIHEVVGDVQQLHLDAKNENALFQVASQFNLLEMTGPSVTPERGVGIYENDPTQGPACAISCGAGTIYRNYFVPIAGKSGQTSQNQIDCSANLGRQLGNDHCRLWSMQNGYLFPSTDGLAQISNRLQISTANELDDLMGELQIGLQWNTAVTLPRASHRVSQAYCSALPVAYGTPNTDDWTDFARLILDAAYESTICAAIINSDRTGQNKLFLTMLGGGVFGNRDVWIVEAIRRAITKYRKHDLNIAIVSYGQSNPVVSQLISDLNRQ